MYKINKITSHTTVDFAAEELKKYMRMMMPECGEIFIQYAPEAKDGLRLGIMEDFGLDTSEAEDIELDDIIHIDTDGENGIIAGSNPRSVLLAVYRYLHENGCRWLFPGIDGEMIPMQDVKATKYHKMADCRYRGECNEGSENQPNMMEVIDFMPKVGLNVFMIEFFNPKTYYDAYYDHWNNPAREPEPITREIGIQWKRQCEAELSKRSMQFHDMGHGWTAEPFGLDAITLFEGKPATYPDDMLQYIAMTDGRRGLFKDRIRAYDTNICMSNPKAREILNKAVVEYAYNHQNVDYLHVWLADMNNNHCECEECLKKTPSDWYAILMNELDEMLTEKGLPTRIVFIAYVDTSWPPVQEKIYNPDRFTLLVAPITRSYTESVIEDVSDVTYPAFKHNDNVLFDDVNQYVKAGVDWQNTCGVRAMLYEYHFYVNQFYHPGVISLARLVYDDIINYKKNGLNGLINDCTQRCFWPNGFAFYIYGQLQFDTSLSFDDLLEDYFSHAYGEDWKEVLHLFEKIGEAMDPLFITGKRSVDPEFNKWYNPSVAAELRKMPKIAEDAKEFLENHKIMPKRAQTVAYKLLRYYMEYCVGIAGILLPKCFGAGLEAQQQFEKFLLDFGKNEIEIQTYFDQGNFGYSMMRILSTDDMGLPAVGKNAVENAE